MIGNHVRVELGRNEYAGKIVLTTNINMKDLSWIIMNREQALELLRILSDKVNKLPLCGVGSGGSGGMR